jgi:hypothetical protein
MNAKTIHDSETVIRSIARWGSAVAAIVFSVAFLTDNCLSWYIVSEHANQIGLIVAMFAFYALALTKRFEALGSVMAFASMVAAYFATSVQPNLIFLAVGIPILFHLVAMVLHRYTLPRVQA